MHCNNGLNNKLVKSLVENKVAEETGDLKYLQDSMYDFVKTLKEIILGEYSSEFFNKYVDEALKLHGSNLEEFLKIPKMGLELRQALESIDDAIDTSNQDFRDNLVLLLDRFQTTLDNMEYEARSPYDIAVKYGFEGTEEEWLSNILNSSETAHNIFQDAKTFADFLYKPADFTVNRRLAPAINTLQHHIDYFANLDNVFLTSVAAAKTKLNNSVVEAEGKVAYIETTVQDAINNTAVEGGVLADTFVTTTINGVGTVARTQRSKNSDIRSAKDFGAVGDGITDDTLALTAFIEAGGGLLHATDSFYAISGGITVTNPFTLIGVYGTPKIKLVDNSSGTLIRANGVLGVSISNLDLDGNEAMQPLENGGHALRFDNCTQVCLVNIYAHDTMQSTISMTNVDYFAFKNVRVEVSRSDGIKFTNCSMGIMDNILSRNHPKSNKHTSYGQVSAIELHDGTNNIHLRNIRIINDDTDPTVGQGLNITTHDSEVAITHSIIVDGLYTSGMYNGVNIINKTNNVVINNHTSVNDRAAVLITSDASDITFNDFNYTQDMEFVHTSTAYGIYLGANSKNISFNNGSFLSRVSCVASIAATKNLRNINFYNCDFVSLNSRALKLEGGSSGDYVDMSFYNCSFESNMSSNVQNTIGMASNAGSLYCRVEFTRCTFRGDAPSAARSIMEVSWNGLILNNCTFFSEKKSAITFMHSVTDTDINHCKFYGLSDGKPTIEIRAAPKNLKFKHNDVYGHSQAFLINSISSADSVIQNVIINDNYFDCSSSVFRFLNEADSIYIDKFMLNNNVKMNANWVYTNLKLGVNSTNIVSVGNIPEAQLVVPDDVTPEA